MELKLRFLGRFSEDAAGIDLPATFEAGLTVGAMRTLMGAALPDIADRLLTCMVAVNTEYVGNDRTLADGDEVAFLPPVSGG